MKQIFFEWEVDCNKKINLWLPLPIPTENQKILNCKLNFIPEKIISNENFKYVFMNSNKNKLNAITNLKIKEVKKYSSKKPKDYLNDEPLLQLDLVKRLAKELENPRAFYKWIIRNIHFPKSLERFLKNSNYADSVSLVLKNREGECCGKSILFIALCRASGIPARIVNGFYFYKNKWFPHHWAEYWKNGFWVPVDCNIAQQEKRDCFGLLDNKRITISKGSNFSVYKNGKVNFLQMGFSDGCKVKQIIKELKSY